MVTTKQHDFLNRLQGISSVPSASSVVSFSYDYNSANQRTLRREADGSYWRYGFDSLGQVKSGKKYWADGTPVAGQQFEYGFDDIGNRKQTKAGGDENGLNLRTNTYGANLLNQYTNRNVQGAVDVMGVALATNTVTVNTAATYRKREYFRKELSVANTSVPVWLQVDVAAPNETPVTRHEFVPRTPEAFTYDADGNLTSDGRWTNTWDAENRLIKVESLSTSPTGSKRKVTWEFDGKGRRIRQTTYDGSSGSYVVTEDQKFLSDGWRHIAELNATNNAVLRSYVWGLDLTGTMDGAGGVGGLLMMYSAASGIHFHAYDGNGNVAALTKANDGSSSASYEYGLFGEPLRVTGPAANENAFRFSTKRANDTLGLVLYEYRVYRPDLGRWLSRDPEQELGGKALLGFTGNDPVNRVDRLGLDIVCRCPEKYFAENGITPDMYESEGDRYKAKAGISGPTSGVGEILWKMLQDGRTFTALARSVEQLKLHVKARQTVVRTAFQVWWGMPPGDRQEKWSPDFWSSPIMLKNGADPAKAVEDPFLNPQNYKTGCNTASMLVLLKGILDTVGAKQFKACPSDQLMRPV